MKSAFLYVIIIFIAFVTRETLKSIQSQVTTLTSARKGKGTSVNETEESNRRFLRELKVEQVYGYIIVRSRAHVSTLLMKRFINIYTCMHNALHPGYTMLSC